MLSGDEEYAFENLHPAKPLVKGRLPGVAPRILLGADMLGERRDAQEFRAVMERRLDRKNGGAALALRDKDLVPEALLLPDTAMDAALKAAKSENLRMIRARRRKEREHEAMRDKFLAQGLDPAQHEIPPLPPEPEIEIPDSIEDLPAFAAKMKAEAEQSEKDARREAEEAEAQAEARAREMGASEADIVRMREQRRQKPKGPPAFSAAGMRRQLEEIVAQGRALGGDMSPITATLEDPKAQATWEAAEDKLAAAYLASAQHQDPAPRLDATRSAELRAELAATKERSWNRANFCGADLSGIDLSGRDLSGIWLDGADLRGANLANANLKDAVLAHTDLEGCRLDQAILEGANLGGARLRDASLVGAILKKACFVGGCDATGANFTKADLTAANLRGLMLMGADFSQAEMPGADLSGAELTAASFAAVNATGVRLTDAHLSNASMKGANLKHADLARADLRAADLSGVCAYEANLSRAVTDRGTSVSGMKRTRMRYLPLAEAK